MMAFGPELCRNLEAATQPHPACRALCVVSKFEETLLRRAATAFGLLGTTTAE